PTAKVTLAIKFAMHSSDSERSTNKEDQVESHSPDALGETMALQGETSASPESGLQRQPEKWVGRQLGKYKVTEVLGVGGMGVVLKAYDSSIERDVAIKVLPGELSSNEVALG